MKNNYSIHINKNTKIWLRQAAILCASAGFLAGCGQRGSLYIPTAPEAAQRSTIVDTLTKPATTTPQASPDSNAAPTK